MRSLLSSLAVVAVLCGAGVAAWQFGFLSSVLAALERDEPKGTGKAAPGKPSAAGGASGKAARTVAVEAVPAERRTIERRLAAIGTLESNESVVMRSEIAGRLSAIHFEEGQPVDIGALIVVLDPAALRAEVAEMEARLELSKRNAERIKRLFSQRMGSATDQDEAIAAQRVAEAGLNLARVRLAKTRITAPFEGILGLRRLSVGAYVNPGDELVTLDDIDPLKVDFRVAEGALPLLQVGQQLQVRVDAFPGREFSGEVYAIAPRVDVQGRTVSLRARLPNPDGVLRPGIFARVELVLERRENAIVVPEQAIVAVAGGQAVYRVVDGKAELTPVTLGQRSDARVEVLSGLEVGETVVTAGQIKLRDGAPVAVSAPPQTNARG